MIVRADTELQARTTDRLHVGIDEVLLAEMEVLGLFANEAAIALDLLQKARAARSVLEEDGGDAAALARFAARLDEAEPDKREAALQLLDALGRLLKER